MIYKELIIRSDQQLKQSKKPIVEALLHEANAKDKRQIPLVYKYIESKKSVDTSVIGTITDIKKDKSGNIVGTICINDCMKASEHFTGVVDNFSANLETSKVNGKMISNTKLSHGIIYDKFVKQTIDAKRDVSENQQFHREGTSPEMDYVATASDDNPLQDPKVMEELHKLMERELGKEAD